MADSAEVVLTPGEAARQLGVSPSGLRRLAVIYGEVYGDLQKDAGGTSRIWTQEAVVRLQRARALMAAGQARSVKDALIAVEGGASPRVEVAVSGGDVAAALGMVATQLEAVLESNRRLEAEVAALRLEVEARALPPGASPERIDRALEVEMASERPPAVEDGGGAAQSPATGQGAAQGAAQAVEDGPAVRVVRWLEQRLRGRHKAGR
jgi:hypothetical protein